MARQNAERPGLLVGDLDLEEERTTTMDKYQGLLKVAPATFNHKLTNVHQVLAYAVERKWMVRMPTMRWRRESEGRVRWLKGNEEVTIFSLLEAWGEDEVADFFKVPIDTGMRCSELLTATPAQIDGEWLRLWKTKTRQARSVPLSERSQVILARRLCWTDHQGRSTPRVGPAA